MSKADKRFAIALGVVLLASLVGGSAVIWSGPWSAIGNFFTWLNKWAALIQALGTIGALVAAILIPIRIHNNERRLAEINRRLKARSLALALYPELLEAKAKLESLRRNLPNMADIVDLNDPPNGFSKSLSFSLPPTLSESRDQFYLLGEQAAPEVQQFVAVISQYNRMVDKAHLFPVPRTSKIVERLMPHLDVASKVLKDALRNVGSIHDNKI